MTSIDLDTVFFHRAQGYVDLSDQACLQCQGERCVVFFGAVRSESAISRFVPRFGREISGGRCGVRRDRAARLRQLAPLPLPVRELVGR